MWSSVGGYYGCGAGGEGGLGLGGPALVASFNDAIMGWGSTGVWFAAGGNDDINAGGGPDICIGGPGTDTFKNCEVQYP